MKITEELREKLYELMEESWGDGEEVVDALCDMLGDYETVVAVLENDLTFNRYTYDAFSWLELAQLIIYDDILWEDGEDDYYRELKELVDADDQKKIREKLISENWAISTEYGVAIGFDSSIKVKEHEIFEL